MSGADEGRPTPGQRRVGRRAFVKGAAIGAGVAATDLSFFPDLASAATNSITVENALAGTADWDIGNPDSSIEGFPTEYSVNAGATIGFKINSASTNYRIDIYRIGWYKGAGGRKIVSIPPASITPRVQPAPYRDAGLGFVDCGNWSVCASWSIPANAVSGVYVANLVRLDDPARPSNRILFVVRNDGRQTDLLVQTSDTTYQAYNRWGGNSFYYGDDDATFGRAVKVSYNRPIEGGQLENEFYYAELPLVRWLERNGYDVAYTSCIDTERRPAELLKHKVFISSGHDEYWSAGMRANVEAARQAGVNLIFMTGNEVFWKVRWESSFDGTNTPYKTVVCYKETLDNAKIDPNPEWTGTWRDPRFSPPSNGGRPENALTGTLFKAINPVDDTDFAIQVPYAYSRLRFWRKTSIATMPVNTTATLSSGTLGYEWNTDGDLPSRPKGLVRVSQTTAVANEVLQDYGKTYVKAPLTHYMTMYRHTSGSLVWSTGTVQWAWGLDNYHTNRPTATVPVDVRIQQATMNVLADMQAQPGTKQTDLIAVSASTDTMAPVSTIGSPAAGANVPIGTPLTITGTAIDAGGGVVAAVEVSVDGGSTWHPALGTASWSYTFLPTKIGTVNIRVRATDDSCNTEAANAGRNINAVARALPGSIWNANVTPSVPSSSDATPLEVGVRFRSSVNGFATGIRFYKGAGNTGTHVGRLWTSTGALLRTVSFGSETASGWQTAMFTQPAPIDAGTTYVASYTAPAGHYAGDPNYFATAYDLAPLTALANGDGGANGLYSTTLGAFPSSTFGAANYWVDVMFDTDDHLNPTVVSTSPAVGITQVAVASAVSATFSESLTPASVVMELRTAGSVLVAGSTTYDAATRTATFTPSAPLAPSTPHTAKVLAAKDSKGNAMTTPYSWTFTTCGAPGSTPTAIWTTADVPTTASTGDLNPIELGLKFKSDVAGTITGIRFYKGSSNLGTHIGRLWTAAGELRSSVTFQNESASGWQEAVLPAPVPIAANEMWVVSYTAPQGGYAADSAYFATADKVRGPLRGIASGSVGGNGVFHYGAGGGFPTDSYGNANYWVDVVFTKSADVAPPAIVSTTPAASLVSVALSAPLTATFDKAVDPNATTFTLTRDGVTAPGSLSFDEARLVATFQPGSALIAGGSYTATVTAKGANGGVAAPFSWNFTAVTSPGGFPATLWDTSATPATMAANDPSPIEVGVKFRADVDGAITGIRFYKGPGNSGTHIGHLWSTSGELKGSVAFASESQSGWQQANFASPIPVSAGQTYIASYFAPVGMYSATNGQFNASLDRPPLHVLASGVDGGNGVFAYGSGAFPTGSYGATNYSVDVVFVDSSAPSVTSQFPQSGSSHATIDTVVRATFSESVQPATITFELRDGQGVVIAATAGYDDASRTATLTPTGPLSSGSVYTASVSGAKDSGGNPMSAPFSWTFTTTAASTQQFTLFGAAVPATASAADNSALELGMFFRTSVDGAITGVRFFKGAGNSGPHVGTVWSAAGAPLASVTFTGESASGWQTAPLTSPIPVTANTPYVVSYYAPNGGYAVDGGYFANGDVVQGPLVAYGSAGATPNGLFRYGAGGGFPTGSYNACNYWVDVQFVPSDPLG